jgi:hypothetical protein
VLNIIEWLDAGAHFVTVVPNLLEGMIIHPYSKETVRQFLADAAKLETRLVMDPFSTPEEKVSKKGDAKIAPSIQQVVNQEQKV